MRKYLFILLFLSTAIATQAQHHWTVAAGQENVFLYGAQQSYLPGFRVGMDYRYDFSKAYGIGLETGLYFRYTYRRYNDIDITGGWQGYDYIGEPKIVGTNTLYSEVNSLDFFIPIHLTYTYLFYRDWSITTYVGTAVDYIHNASGIAKRLVNYSDGTSEITGSGHGGGGFDFPLEFGLGFTYRHLQVRVGAALSATGYNSISFDETDWKTLLDMPYDRCTFYPAELYFTIGYQFKK